MGSTSFVRGLVETLPAATAGDHHPAFEPAAKIADLADRIAAESGKSRSARRRNLGEHGTLRTAVGQYLEVEGGTLSDLRLAADRARAKRTAGAELFAQAVASHFLRSHAYWNTPEAADPGSWAHVLGLILCLRPTAYRGRAELRDHAVAVAVAADDYRARSNGWDQIYSDGARTYSTDGYRLVSVPETLPAGTYRRNGGAGLISAASGDDVPLFWTSTLPAFIARTYSCEDATHVQTSEALAISSLVALYGELTYVQKVYAAVLDLAKLGQRVPDHVRKTAELGVFDLAVGEPGSEASASATFSGGMLQDFLRLAIDAAGARGDAPPAPVTLRLAFDRHAAVTLSAVVRGELVAALMNRLPNETPTYRLSV